MSDTETYDFVIVGAGAGGCALARRLASSKASPKVLLLETGGANDDPAIHIRGYRGRNMFNPELNYQYMTTPQAHLNNRVTDYGRGKGLGGSTTINFGTTSCPPKDDIDHLGKLVNDEDWGWTAFNKRFRSLENYHWNNEPASMSKYLNPDLAIHGHEGPLHIAFSRTIEKELAPLLDLCEKTGHKLNTDVLSGDPIGCAVDAGSAREGYRITAADFIKHRPSNLTVLTREQVARILFDGKVATGVETIRGKRFMASKEVIISAGAVDSPKLLMLSGIGAKDELAKHNISLVADLPGVGKNLQDHPCILLTYDRTKDSTERCAYYRDPEAQTAALKKFESDGTGPLSYMGLGVGIAYLKLEAVYKSDEFKTLPKHVQAHLQEPTVPSYEVLLNAPDLRQVMHPKDSTDSAIFFVALLNCQSRGVVELSSSDPTAPPRIDPKFLEHVYDRRVAIECIRDMMKVTESPEFAKNTTSVVIGPKPDANDDDILDLWKENAQTIWHAASTVKMGCREDDQACLDSGLCVYGVERLRVADASIYPFLPGCHSQSLAYVAGVTAGDKIARQYSLD